MQQLKIKLSNITSHFGLKFGSSSSESPKGLAPPTRMGRSGMAGHGQFRQNGVSMATWLRTDLRGVLARHVLGEHCPRGIEVGRCYAPFFTPRFAPLRLAWGWLLVGVLCSFLARHIASRALPAPNRPKRWQTAVECGGWFAMRGRGAGQPGAPVAGVVLVPAPATRVDAAQRQTSVAATATRSRAHGGLAAWANARVAAGMRGGASNGNHSNMCAMFRRAALPGVSVIRLQFLAVQDQRAPEQRYIRSSGCCIQAPSCMDAPVNCKPCHGLPQPAAARGKRAASGVTKGLAEVVTRATTGDEAIMRLVMTVSQISFAMPPSTRLCLYFCVFGLQTPRRADAACTLSVSACTHQPQVLVSLQCFLTPCHPLSPPGFRPFCLWALPCALCPWPRLPCTPGLPALDFPVLAWSSAPLPVLQSASLSCHV